MSFSNYTNKAHFTVKTEGFKFVKVTDIELDKKYDFLGCFITKGKYGDSPVIITNGMLVNAPKYMLQTLKDIMNDNEAITEINDGKASFIARKYTDKNGTERIGINLVER